MTRKEAHRLVRTTNGPTAWVAFCPYCKGHMVILRKAEGVTWGQRTKAIAQVTAHIIENHPGRTK